MLFGSQSGEYSTKYTGKASGLRVGVHAIYDDVINKAVNRPHIHTEQDMVMDDEDPLIKAETD